MVNEDVFLFFYGTLGETRSVESRAGRKIPPPYFLDASTHLYKRVCPSVGPSVRRLVRRSVTRFFYGGKRANYE